MTHHLIHDALAALKNEYVRAHPALPSKAELEKRIAALKALVEQLPDEAAAPVAAGTSAPTGAAGAAASPQPSAAAAPIPAVAQPKSASETKVSSAT
jgi:uncharacterized small protein (DUF1192 family)